MGDKKKGLRMLRLPRNTPAWYGIQDKFLNELKWAGCMDTFMNAIHLIISNWDEFKKQCDNFDENVKKLKGEKNKKKKVEDDTDEEDLEDYLQNNIEKEIGEDKRDKNNKKRKNRSDEDENDNEDLNVNDEIDDEFSTMNQNDDHKNDVKISNKVKPRKPTYFSAEPEIYRKCNDIYLQYLSTPNDKIIKKEEFTLMWEAYRRLALIVAESNLVDLESVFPLDTLRMCVNEDKYDDPPTPNID